MGLAEVSDSVASEVINYVQAKKAQPCFQIAKGKMACNWDTWNKNWPPCSFGLTYFCPQINHCQNSQIFSGPTSYMKG